MKRVPKESLRTALLMTFAAVLATILVAVVDVQPVGVEGTKLGFATINTDFFARHGQNETFYKLSKYAGYICFATAAGFAVFFMIQLIQRKSLSKVDRNLSVLILLYILTASLYLLFDKVLIINYRPVIRDKGLESSFPSTHVMIAWVVMVSAVDQWNIYIKNENLKIAAIACSLLIMLVVIVARMFSGVHWLTDILGGILIGDMLIAWYRYAAGKKK
ncbi:MAG: phosphatase PAP2 family protein [Anaerolineaceae bacterium]|nr:phosphatase PAP2 family protein [Anaerolineaceae bacterium]